MPRLTKKDRAFKRAVSLPVFHNDDQVMSFAQWCALNGFSEPTGKRVLGRGDCAYVQLNLRRIGITVRDNREYQQSRTRKSGAVS
jgi:hypothetical protein